MLWSELTITTEEARQRLDRVLAARYPDHSRSYLQELIRAGHVRRSAGAQAPCSPGELVKPGAGYEIRFPDPEPSNLLPEPIPLSVLHQDADIVVLDKPSGMVVHPGAGAKQGTLVHALLHHLPRLSGIGGVERPGIVHRLDKDTSGVMVVALHDAAHRSLSSQFAARGVEKVYAALVWGRMPAQGAIDVPIGRDRAQRTKISTRTGAPRDALTRYRVMESVPGYSWLEVRPRTGRTHQIRVHLKHAGHPIVGDPIYGGAGFARDTNAAHREALASFGRLALHAWKLTLKHPSSGATMTFEAPVPKDFLRLLEVLK